MNALRAVVKILGVSTLLFLLITVGVHLLILARQRFPSADASFYVRMSSEARSSYAHMTEPEVNDLLRATWVPGWVYEPWTGFRERERSSKFVNVDANGIRANRGDENSLEKLEHGIWFFGGSTTFGYGVADSETIPAQLEHLLERTVINLGRGYFYSAQENLLLTRLLGTGLKPAAVWFLDGINERCDLDVYQREMSALFAQVQAGYRWNYPEFVKPVTHLLDRLRNRAERARARAATRPTARLDQRPCESYGMKLPVRAMLAAQLRDRAAICHAYDLLCETFVQPFAGVHGVHRGQELSPSARAGLKEHYPHLEDTFRDAGAVFVSDALDGDTRQAYVDDVHYSAWASRAIAEVIAARATPVPHGP